MAGKGRIEVDQHVRVLDVKRDGNCVSVDVYGGAASRCGFFVCQFPDASASEVHEQVLRSWRDAATVLTFVLREDEVALIDDVAQFEASWAATG